LANRVQEIVKFLGLGEDDAAVGDGFSLVAVADQFGNGDDVFLQSSAWSRDRIRLALPLWLFW
jgi:hypothetical protein